MIKGATFIYSSDLHSLSSARSNHEKNHAGEHRVLNPKLREVKSIHGRSRKTKTLKGYLQVRSFLFSDFAKKYGRLKCMFRSNVMSSGSTYYGPKTYVQRIMFLWPPDDLCRTVSIYTT